MPLQSVPHLRPLPTGSSATVAKVMRCGRSTGERRVFQSFPGVQRRDLLRKRDQVYEVVNMKPRVNRFSRRMYAPSYWLLPS